MRFANFLSGWFITAIVVNPPERKPAKRTSVYWPLCALKEARNQSTAQYAMSAYKLLYTNLLKSGEGGGAIAPLTGSSGPAIICNVMQCATISVEIGSSLTENFTPPRTIFHDIPTFKWSSKMWMWSIKDKLIREFWKRQHKLFPHPDISINLVSLETILGNTIDWRFNYSEWIFRLLVRKLYFFDIIKTQ